MVDMQWERIIIALFWNLNFHCVIRRDRVKHYRDIVKCHALIIPHQKSSISDFLFLCHPGSHAASNFKYVSVRLSMKTTEMVTFFPTDLTEVIIV